MKLSSLIAISFVLFALAEGKTLICKNFLTTTWWRKDIYECESDSLQITAKSDRTITSALGQHKYARSNGDVGAIWIHATTVRYFPKGLHDVYNDLIGIGITDSRLQEIHSDDLKPFSKLIKLFLQGNELETLDGDLFKHNPLIHRVKFDNNRIKHVGDDFLVGSEGLYYLHFENNPCFSGKVEDDRFKAMMMILDIQRDCFDVQHYLEEKSG